MMGDKWKPRRVAETDWTWMCAFLTDAGGGLFRFACNAKQFGLIHTRDDVVKCYVESIGDQIYWRAWQVAEPQNVLEGCGPVDTATCDLMAKCVLLRARRMLRNHPVESEVCV